MKKYCVYLLVLCLVMACSKSGEKGTATEAILIPSSWQTYKYFLNGVEDPNMENRVPIFTFRKDSLYMRLINPLQLDTFLADFRNEQNLQLKPVNNPFQRPLNLKIDSLEGGHFNFTITDGVTGSHLYKTVKL